MKVLKQAFGTIKKNTVRIIIQGETEREVLEFSDEEEIIKLTKIINKFKGVK